jgi:hypothetical protein
MEGLEGFSAWLEYTGESPLFAKRTDVRLPPAADLAAHFVAEWSGGAGGGADAAATVAEPAVAVPTAGAMTVGRATDSNLFTWHPQLVPQHKAAVSRAHARIEWEASAAVTAAIGAPGWLSITPSLAFFLVDLGSTNGSYVNGVRVAPHQRTPLEDGDDVVFGGNATIAPGVPPSVYFKDNKDLLRAFAYTFHVVQPQPAILPDPTAEAAVVEDRAAAEEAAADGVEAATEEAAAAAGTADPAVGALADIDLGGGDGFEHDEPEPACEVEAEAEADAGGQPPATEADDKVTTAGAQAPAEEPASVTSCDDGAAGSRSSARGTATGGATVLPGLRRRPRGRGGCGCRGGIRAKGCAVCRA